MIIRLYESSDCREITELFYGTVHKVNAKDYTEAQLNAWAPENPDIAEWNKTLSGHYSIVAVLDGVIVGFGDTDGAGYLDRLFVHKDYQHKGIGSALCDKLEKSAHGKIITHASITARTFFEKRGYKVKNVNRIVRRGTELINFTMEKVLRS